MNEQEVFEKALSIRDEAARQAFLADVCEGNASLLREVELLLESAPDAVNFMERKAADSLDFTSDEAETLGRIEIDNYKLLEKIGEGGFGVVYMAEQLKPIQRRVALKVIKAGMDTKQVIARFEAERQALALMEHANIAKIFDAGTTKQGRPFFVMELVHGIPVTEYSEQRTLTTAERLRLISKVCSAVQHAHQKGIIHRDIKPSNILVCTEGDEPVPKVIDFGVAKATQGRLTDKTVFTDFRQFVGTPAYMSPEQAQMSPGDVDTRSDIYSLGVLLYELLTGTTPLDSKELAQAGCEEICRRIREEDAQSPSKRLSSYSKEKITTLARQRKLSTDQFTSSIRGELEWIVMKAVAKERARRYDTASALADDIQRYLAEEPVSAVPPSAAYQLRKFASRHKSLIVGIASLAVLLVLGTTISTWQAIRAHRAEAEQIRLRELADQESQRARANEMFARKTAYAGDMFLAGELVAGGEFHRVAELLGRYVPTDDERTDFRGWEWRALQHQLRDESLFSLLTLPNSNADAVFSVDASPDGRWLATTDTLGRVRIWDIDARQLVKTLDDGHNGLACYNNAFFSPSGDRLFAGTPGGIIKSWQVPGWSELPWQAEHGGPLRSMTISRDGKLLAGFGFDNKVSVWDPDVPGAQPQKQIEGGRYAAGSVAISPNNQHLVVGQRDFLRILEPKTLNEVTKKEFKGRFAITLDFSPDGETLACGFAFQDSDVYVLETSNWSVVSKLKGREGYIRRVRYSHDGRFLASASAGGKVRLWDTDSWQEVDVFHGHRDEAWSLAITRDNERLFSGCKDGRIRAWRPEPQTNQTWPMILPDNIIHAALSPTGELVLGVYEDGAVRLLSTNNLKIVRDLPELVTDNHWTSVLFHPKRMVFCLASAGGLIQVVNLEGELQVTKLNIGKERVRPLKFLQEGQRLVVQSEQELAIWNIDGEQIDSAETSSVTAVESIPNSSLLYVNDMSTKSAIIWNTAEGRLQPMDDGQLAAYEKSDINFADPKTRAFILERRGYKGTHLAGFTISPDGKRLIEGGGKRWPVTIKDVETQRELLRLRATGFNFKHMSCSGDGSAILAKSTAKHSYHLWRAPSWDEIKPVWGDEPVPLGDR